MDLVENGQSDYEIVFTGDATGRQYKSAEVLQSYIEKISDAKLAIVDENSQSTDKHKIFIGQKNNLELVTATPRRPGNSRPERISSPKLSLMGGRYSAPRVTTEARLDRSMSPRARSCGARSSTS